MANVSKFIEKKLGLKVNMTKSKVTKPNDIKYLGFGGQQEQAVEGQTTSEISGEAEEEAEAADEPKLGRRHGPSAKADRAGSERMGQLF